MINFERISSLVNASISDLRAKDTPKGLLAFISIFQDKIIKI